MKSLWTSPDFVLGVLHAEIYYQCLNVYSAKGRDLSKEFPDFRIGNITIKSLAEVAAKLGEPVTIRFGVENCRGYREEPKGKKK